MKKLFGLIWIVGLRKVVNLVEVKRVVDRFEMILLARDGVERKKMELDPNFLMQHLLNLILFQKDLLPPRLPMSILHLIFLLLRLLLLTLLLLPLRFLKKRICR
jgi:hypothetical protein